MIRSRIWDLFLKIFPITLPAAIWEGSFPRILTHIRYWHQLFLILDSQNGFELFILDCWDHKQACTFLKCTCWPFDFFSFVSCILKLYVYFSIKVLFSKKKKKIKKTGKNSSRKHSTLCLLMLQNFPSLLFISFILFLTYCFLKNI